jgi:hypothetical protein
VLLVLGCSAKPFHHVIAAQAEGSHKQQNKTAAARHHHRAKKTAAHKPAASSRPAMLMLVLNRAAAASVRPGAGCARNCARPRPSTAAASARGSSSSRQLVKANFFKFGKADAPLPSMGRSDFSAEDVEYYFNYMGMLATEGTYDRLEAMLAQGLAPVDLLLLMAASENDSPKLEELVGAGADLGVKDLNGKSALQLATKPEVIAMLQKAGAK